MTHSRDAEACTPAKATERFLSLPIPLPSIGPQKTTLASAFNAPVHIPNGHLTHSIDQWSMWGMVELLATDPLSPNSWQILSWSLQGCAFMVQQC